VQVTTRAALARIDEPGANMTLVSVKSAVAATWTVGLIRGCSG
jgi:hypothetical protein